MPFSTPPCPSVPTTRRAGGNILLPDSQAHYPALDGLRGLAILLVLLIHVASPLLPVGLMKYANSGWTGVDLFFVLSGFLITGILYDAKGTPHYFRNFYMRRVLRILPLYYGMLLLALVVLPLAVSLAAEYRELWADQLWLWLHASNFLIIRNGLRPLPYNLSPLWSLAVEEQFYLFWPLLVFLLSRRSLLKTCAGVMLAVLALRVGLFLRGYSLTFLYVLTFTRLDGFAAGGLVALAWRDPAGRAWLARWARPAAVACLVLLVGRAAKRGGILDYSDPLVCTLGFTILAIFFAGLLASAVTARPGAAGERLLSLGVLRWLGKYSYGIYISHNLIYYLVRTLFPTERASEGLRSLLVKVSPTHLNSYLSLALSLAFAYASWHLYEKHFLKLKRFFPRESSRAAVPAAHPRREAKAA